jgi:hypothetical protein
MVREHPDYQRVELGVPAEQALMVVFGPSEAIPPAADVLEAVDGHEVVLRKTRAGRVTSIEIL